MVNFIKYVLFEKKRLNIIKLLDVMINIIKLLEVMIGIRYDWF